jgi:hypothetical protein
MQEGAKKFRKELRYKWPSTASEELKNAESDLFGKCRILSRNCLMNKTA